MKYLNFINVVDNIVKSQQIFHSILEGNEAQTRWFLIDPLILDGWGFNRSDVIVEYSISQQYRVNKYDKLDYCILVENTPKILIEAKSLGINVFDKYAQLESYFNRILREHDYSINGLVGILTDGDLYLFYTNSSIDKMDDKPFYTIRLSGAEDLEKNKLLQYSKSNLLNKEIKVISSDEVFDLFTWYRIDTIESAIDYFKAQDIDVVINSVSLNGRIHRGIKTFKQLYKSIIKEINNLKPDFIYTLGQQELKDSNGTISNLQFSLNYINSSEFLFKTKYGDVHISMPTSDKGCIDRIIKLVKLSNFGLHNISVELSKK